MDDLIRRQDAIENILFATADGDKADWIIGVIKSVPSAQKTGKWQKYEGRFDYNWKCSECGCSAWEKTDYCAYCGARMESKNENTSDTYDGE